MKFPIEVLVNTHAQVFDITLQRIVCIPEVVKNFQIGLIRNFFCLGRKITKLDFLIFRELICYKLSVNHRKLIIHKKIIKLFRGTRHFGSQVMSN